MQVWFPCTQAVPDSSIVEVCFPCTDFVFVRRGCGCTVPVCLSCVRDISFVADHVYRRVFYFIDSEKSSSRICFTSRLCVVIAGVWSNSCDSPKLLDDDGIHGEKSMFGPGRTLGRGHVDGDMSVDGFGSHEQNFNRQAITPFFGGELQGGPISLIGNTRSMGHMDDLSMVMSPNGICSVCEKVVSGCHCPHCTVCNQVVHSGCRTHIGMNATVCHRCVGERNRQIESCQRAQTTHRVATNLQQFEMLKSLELFWEFQQPLRSGLWW